MEDLLRQALERIESGEHEAAAWRLADAGLMLRKVLTAKEAGDLIGYDVPTGRGAFLPTDLGSYTKTGIVNG